MPVISGDDECQIDRAARALAGGELVALPTETVYGLGARADDDAAVARIFRAKGRPSDHPLIVHVADQKSALAFAASWPDSAQRLSQAFWPGPVTLILPRRAGVAEAAAGGHTTIGLRCPSHPAAHALLVRAAALGVAGVAAPSANRFGRVSPTRAEHVVGEFGPDMLVLDGGASQLGIESCIVDCTRDVPVLLRPGVIDRGALELALGQPLRDRDEDAPRAPGTLDAHYAPRARVRVFSAAGLRDALACTDPARVGVAVYSPTEPPAGVEVDWQPMPTDAGRAAHELFAVLRAFDDRGAREIWVEQPPDSPQWEGVRDRLHRAAAS